METTRPAGLSLEQLRARLRELEMEVLHLHRLTRIGAWVERVLSPGVSLTISRRRGGQEELDEYLAEARGDGIQAERMLLDSLDEAADVFLPAERARKCLGPCGLVKDVSQFCRIRGKGGVEGRNRYCRECERERVRRHDERRKAEGQRRPHRPA